LDEAFADTAESVMMDCADSTDRQSHKKHIPKEKSIKLKDEQLNLQCEWKDCDYRISSLDQFVSHVSLHIPQLAVRLNKDGTGNGFVVLTIILIASSSVIVQACLCSCQC
jgi:hypothetical protein